MCSSMWGGGEGGGVLMHRGICPSTQHVLVSRRVCLRSVAVDPIGSVCISLFAHV